MSLRVLKSNEDPLEGEYISIDGHIAVDQQPFVKAVVNGSKQVFRDPRDGAEAVLDPHGDKAYAREARKGQWEDFEYCVCRNHVGERWLPAVRFGIDASTASGRNHWCLKCRQDAEHERRMKDAERRGLKLREKAGRPPKWKR